ncbi:type 2 isopentenyl-diphosphate Delta-isomerase [Heliobacterium gestii]|uniref:Isopentenyl-diphosphate delta-isomerase n=1 Tax=Heliomicrobium gestii TaxID=2699 RepID=A0A845L582_HELGE|nr:type 2 isopentenyl-diphosphate Delta-isomerase [Heliomicrobium gestii]MBM7865515.1 isopentenyl-diphosphate delta-isomerase [Heliomicrobium gestii]MZP41767.1 type 2 isopentenyl-diphosphate Delta-isomerase [Heliomicrobium gestii]
MDIRQQRKLDHIRQALALDDGPALNGFTDVRLIHDALPAVDFRSIDLSVPWGGKRLAMPLLINAITGGTSLVTEINRRLARLAARNGVAVAVGSQAAALRDPRLRDSYRVMRDENPDGVVLANVNPNTPAEKALEAVNMLEADGLQVHLNPAQELAMAEGDRDFRHWTGNIAELARHCPVPLIVKEVGAGISLETARRLLDLGVRHIDVGGAGGTNFVAIELRRQGQCLPAFEAWGIPTAVSLAETVWAVHRGLPAGEKACIIASGGIRDGWDGAKALAMGASLVGIAGAPLKGLLGAGSGAFSVAGNGEGDNAAQGWIDRFRHALRLSLALTGCCRIDDLQNRPCLLTGDLRERLDLRGIAAAFWARRSGEG